MHRFALTLAISLSTCGLPALAAAPSEELEPGAVPPALVEAGEVVPNLRVVSPGLLRGGQPTVQGLRLLKESGVRTIINLRNEDVLVAREGAAAKALGLDYVSIPLTVFDTPSEADLKRFLRVVADTRRQPVFVHCLHGRDRTGTLVAIHRVRNQGWAADRAYAEMTQLGFRPGFANLTAAVFRNDSSQGRSGKPPSGAVIVADIKQRLEALLLR